MLIRKSWWDEVVGNIELSLNAWLLFNYLNKWKYFNKGSATRKSRCCKGCVVVVAVFCFDSQNDALKTAYRNGCWELFICWNNLLWWMEVVHSSHHFSYEYGCCDVPITPYLISKALVCAALLQIHSCDHRFRLVIWIILFLDRAFLNDENT